jgi:hypothetical protein
MNTFLIFVLIILTLIDGCFKYKLANNGHDINIVIEVIVDKMGWAGYFVLLIILLGIIALIDSIVLNFILISAMTFLLAEQIKQLKIYGAR